MTKNGILGLLAVAALSVTLLGCGAEPGGDFLDGDTFDQQMPISGALQKIAQAYDLLASGSISSARQSFLVVVEDRPKAADLSMAKVGVGFCDVRTLGSSEGLAEFEEAFTADPTNPDARVGLAGALISRGKPEDVRRAVTLLEEIDKGNTNFVYTDRWKLGISNAEVHALLAYAYRLTGDKDKSRVQADIARALDANLDDTTVDQILSVLEFIP